MTIDTTLIDLNGDDRPTPITIMEVLADTRYPLVCDTVWKVSGVGVACARLEEGELLVRVLSPDGQTRVFSIPVGVVER